MYDYSEDAATAAELIAEFGRVVTLRVRANEGESFDPIFENTDTSVQAVITDYKSRDIDGTLVKIGDKRIIFANAVTITQDMQIIDGTTTYSIVQNRPVAPGDTVIVYKVQARA